MFADAARRAAGSTVITEDFNDADTLARLYTSSGAPWITTQGGMGISNQRGTVTKLGTPALDSNSPDHSLEVTFLNSPSGAPIGNQFTGFGLWVRGAGGGTVADSYLISADTSGNYWGLYRGMDNAGGLQQVLDLAPYMGGVLADGDRLTLEARGSQLRIYRNHNLCQVVAINANGCTQAGLYFSSWSSSFGQVKCDDINLTAL